MGVERAIDITAGQHKTILALLERYLPGAVAWVYGSRAKWTSRPQSDLDLVVFPAPEQHDRIGALREAFEESNLPFRVDLFVWDEVSDSFRKQIESDRVVLVEKEERSESDEWTESRLADACMSIDYGLTASASNCKTGPHFLRITDIVSGYIDWKKVPHVSVDDDMESRYRLYDGDIVIARTGASTGISAYVKNPPKAVFASYLVRLQTKPDFDARFIAYYLKSKKFREFIHGVLGDKSAQPNASAATMTAAPLRVPKNKAEQRAIANILGSLDDKIELNRRMNGTLEAMARAWFKSWFVDFEPVRAKMEGRDTGLPKHIADFFPDRMMDSELGEIPEGWEVSKLYEMIDLNPKRPLQNGKLAPYLDMANMPTKNHVPDVVRERPFGSGMRFANGDTLVARITPCLENGKTAYIDFLKDGEVGWGSTEYIVMKPIPPLPDEFAYYLARSTRFREFAIQNMTGTSGRQRVPANALSDFLFPLPPNSIAIKFGRIARSILSRVNEATQESNTLATLRDTLLPKLMSGEVKVR